MSFFFSSMTMLVQYFADSGSIFRMLRWTMGSLGHADYDSIVSILPFLVLGFTVMIVFMNSSHRRTFCGRLSLREYIDEIWEERVYAPLGHGLDASRAHLLKFSRYYWPKSEKLAEWLVPSWDEWAAADPPPVWLTAKFKRLVEAVVPPEAQPLAVLKEQANKRRKAAISPAARPRRSSPHSWMVRAAMGRSARCSV